MPRYPKISIVTPSLDQGPFIEEAILSVENQGYPDIEHLVIDGESRDDTHLILSRHADVNWVSEPDDGQSDALNKGFRRATGEIVGWLNADDRYLPGCLAAVAEYMERNPEVDILFGDYRWIDHNGDVMRERRELDFDLFMLKYLHVLYIPTAASFFRRRIFDDGEFLDTSYHYAMDYEYYLRLALAGRTFAHLPRILADYRWHDASKSETGAVRQREEHLKALWHHDPLLRRISPSVRPAVTRALTVAARAKRYGLKTAKGLYKASR